MTGEYETLELYEKATLAEREALRMSILPVRFLADYYVS
jgi:hypothetical protein